MVLPHGANTIVLLVACAKGMALLGAQLYGIQPMIENMKSAHRVPNTATSLGWKSANGVTNC